MEDVFTLKKTKKNNKNISYGNKSRKRVKKKMKKIRGCRVKEWVNHNQSEGTEVRVENRKEETGFIILMMKLDDTCVSNNKHRQIATSSARTC